MSPENVVWMLAFTSFPLKHNPFGKSVGWRYGNWQTLRACLYSLSPSFSKLSRSFELKFSMKVSAKSLYKILTSALATHCLPLLNSEKQLYMMYICNYTLFRWCCTVVTINTVIAKFIQSTTFNSINFTDQTVNMIICWSFSAISQVILLIKILNFNFDINYKIIFTKL